MKSESSLDYTDGHNRVSPKRRFPVWLLLPLLILAMIAAFLYLYRSDRDKTAQSSDKPGKQTADIKGPNAHHSDGWQIPVYTGSPGGNTSLGGGSSLGGGHHK